MENYTNEVYSEVYSLLNEIGKEFIEKIPTNVYQTIVDLKSSQYNPKFNLNKPLTKQNIREETLVLIGLFHINYWCSSDTEKDSVSRIVKNRADYMELINAQFGKKYRSKVSKEMALVEYKGGFLKKIITSLSLRFRHKNFKKVEVAHI